MLKFQSKIYFENVKKKVRITLKEREVHQFNNISHPLPPPLKRSQAYKA
jgi:hypothetical protein